MTRVLPRFPTAVRGINALSATTKNGVLEVGIDPTNLAQSADPTAPGNYTFILNSTTDEFELAEVASTIVDIATKDEAETGDDNTSVMSPLRTKQSIAANAREGLASIDANPGAITIEQWLRETPNAVAAGAKGDASTNDTAAFARFEAAAPGALVDLGGKTYFVDAVPTKAKYFNGGFKIGTEVVPVSPVPRPHPYAGLATVIANYYSTCWIDGVVWDRTAKVLWRFERMLERHDASSGSRLDVVKSYDMGETWLERRTIFSDPINPIVRGGSFGAMSNGRMGGVFATGTTTRVLWFVYSDDGGATWGLVDITSSLSIANPFPYGPLIPGPSGAAGDFFLSTYAGTAEAKIIRTTDNGLSWTNAVLKTSTGLPGSSPAPVEQAIVQVPERGWLMFTRVQTTPTSAQNLYVSKSSDFSTWSAWEDTGVMLGENPVNAVYDGGQVHVLMTQRSGFLGTTRPDTLLCYSVEAKKLYDSPVLSSIAPQLIAALPQRAVGYIQSCRLSMTANDLHAPWYHLLKAGEGPTSTTRATRAKLIAIRDLPGASLGVDVNQQPIQLVENPIFSKWPRGTTFTTAGTDLGVAGRWRTWGAVRAPITVSQTTLTDAERVRFPFRPKHGLRIRNTGSPATSIGLNQRFIGEDAQRFMRALLVSGDYIMRLYGMGEFPSTYQAVLTTNVGTIGVGSFGRIPAGQTASWVVESRVILTAAPGDVTAVTNANIIVNNGNASLEYDFTLVGAFFYPASFAAAMEFDEQPDNALRVDKYCKAFSGSGQYVGEGWIKTATSVRIAQNHPDMMAVPTAIFSGNWDIEGEGASGSDRWTFTGLTSSSGQHQTVHTATVVGATPGAARFRAADSNSLLLLDTGW